jgi:hypothetical protein
LATFFFGAFLLSDGAVVCDVERCKKSVCTPLAERHQAQHFTFSFCEMHGNFSIKFIVKIDDTRAFGMQNTAAIFEHVITSNHKNVGLYGLVENIC